MTYYAALDVSLRSVAICIVDGAGKVCLERTVASEVAAIAASLWVPRSRALFIRHHRNVEAKAACALALNLNRSHIAL